MTPPVKCQIAESNYHGYHGYWASDFTKVDSHMGTLAQYQQFVKEAHEMGLYVIQDIVVNHLGDYQQITKDVTAETMKASEGSVPETEFFLEPKSVPFSHPEQLPWALNNINDLTYDEWKNNAFYHYNTPISDYTNAAIQYDHTSSNLDDMTTENPVVRNLLRGYFRYWIDKAGIDGYRIDTALYVEPDFFEGFINDTEPDNMGVRAYGIYYKGKKDFINFGEAFSQNEAVVGSYTKSSTGTPRMDGMIYFPLRYALADTISSGGKTSAIGTVLKNRYTKKYYADPDRLVTFIDNHDMDRWGQTMKGNTELMKAAYNIIYTIPGIPQVYYGSEQGFNGECREGMFKGSYCTPGTVQSQDCFETTGDWYMYFQNLNKMRRENNVFRYNTLYVLQETDNSAGIFAYIVREKDKDGNVLSDGKKAIFVMNTATTDKILNASYANITPGDKFELVPYEGISVCPPSGTPITDHFIAGESEKKGNVKLIVPANSCAIYIMTDAGAAPEISDCILTIDEVPAEKIDGKLHKSAAIKGTTNKTGTVKIVLNGDYSMATEIQAEADIQFSTDIDISSYSNGKVSVQLIQESDGIICYSDSKTFIIERPFTLVAQITDPADDDNGVGAAKGILQKPTDPQFSGCLDIRGVDVYRSGNDVRLGIKMGALSCAWNPTSNFFDHVVFYVFISDGDGNGCSVHPKSNYTLPESFGAWDYMYQANGWGQAYYSSAKAGVSNPGTATTPSPINSPAVDWDNLEDNVTGIDKYHVLDWSDYNPEIGDEWADKTGMIWLSISAAAMGYPKDISGYKFYINNWDFDMGSPRGLKEGDAEQYKFGSGTLSVSAVPLVCDEIDTVITIPSL